MRGSLCKSSGAYVNVFVTCCQLVKMADEVQLAQAAHAGGDTIFGKILRNEIPCDFIYEDHLVRLFYLPTCTT